MDSPGKGFHSRKGDLFDPPLDETCSIISGRARETRRMWNERKERERKRGRLNPDKGLVGIASFNCIPSPWLFIVRICEREKRRGKKKVGRKRVARSHIKPLYEGKSSCLLWLNHGLKLLKVSERGVRVSRILEAIPFFLSLSFGHFNAH